MDLEIEQYFGSKKWIEFMLLQCKAVFQNVPLSTTDHSQIIWNWLSEDPQFESLSFCVKQIKLYYTHPVNDNFYEIMFKRLTKQGFLRTIQSNPNQDLKYCYQNCWIQDLIKMLFNVHYLLLLTSFAFQTFLIRVITFQIDIKENFGL